MVFMQTRYQFIIRYTAGKKVTFFKMPLHFGSCFLGWNSSILIGPSKKQAKYLSESEWTMIYTSNSNITHKKGISYQHWNHQLVTKAIN